MTPRFYTASLLAALLTGCGGGSSDSDPSPTSPPVADQPGMTPPPVAQTPPPSAPPTGSPPVAQPPAAPPPGAAPPAAPPVTETPAPPPAGQPPVASPPPAVNNPPPTAPPPVAQPPAAPPAGDTIAGKEIATMLNALGMPIHGGPGHLPQKGFSYDPYIDAPLGTLASYQIPEGGTYRYWTSQYQQATSPYWYYTALGFDVQMSFQDGQLWIAKDMRVRVNPKTNQNPDGSVTYEHDLTFTHPDGGYTIQPEARIPLDSGSITQWILPGTPYYVQLQAGRYENRIRTCWHFRLPGGILRRSCFLYAPIPSDQFGYEGWMFGGETVDDDSHPRYGPVSFEYLPEVPGLPPPPATVPPPSSAPPPPIDEAPPPSS